jgi:adhesin/invasin
VKLRPRYPTIFALATVLAVACTTDTLIGPKDVAILVIAPDSVSIPVHDTILLQGIATDSRGLQYVGERITWTSSNPSVATISADGHLITLAVGGTTVTASAGGKSATAQVTVTPQPTIAFSTDSVGFAGIARGPAPVSQFVVVTNTGGGALTGLTLGAVTYVGPDTGWLSVTPSSATAPDSVTLSVTVDTFPLGTYTASLPISAPKTTNGSKTLKITLTLGAGAPTQASKAAGDAQSVTVKTGVGVLPSVQLKDAYGNVVAGVTVTFAASASNGTLTGAATTTNALGLASVGSWTLDSVAKVDTLTATPTGLPPLTFTATGLAGPASRITRLGLGSQSDTISAGLASPDSARVTDAYGNPVAGAAVTWVAGGPGTLTPAGPTSNAAGVVTAARTLGAVAGSVTDTARAPGLAGSPVLFTVNTGPGTATNLARSGGDGQTDTAGAALATLYTVLATDRAANPVPGVGVTWGASGGGSITPSSSTNALGIASASRVLGTVAGPQGATATVSGLSGSPVSFAATATHGNAAKVAAKAGTNGQSGSINAPITTPPAVVVQDQFGNAVPGVAVTFALGAGGPRNGTITGASPTTDAAGAAALTSWTLGSAAGPDTVTATAAGFAGGGNPVTFIDFGNTVPPGSITAVGGNAQTDTARGTLPVVLSVKVLDAGSSPIGNATVSWTVTGGGGAITPTSTTDISGVATAQWTLGSVAGPQSATATISPLSAPFSATATPATPTQLLKTAGDAQSATVNTTVATAPSVKVTDQFGNAVGGVGITFAVPATHGSVTGASTATASNGIATLGSWTLDSVAGANTLTATAGVALAGNPATFTATGTAGLVSANLSTVAAGTASITACSTACVAGTTASTITVTAVDQFGNPINGASVNPFSATGSGNTFTPGLGSTNSSGVLTSAFNSTQATNKSITATVNGVLITQSPTVAVTPAAVDLTTSTVAVSSGSMSACSIGCLVGSTAVTVTVTVRDAFSNVRPGSTVTISANGSGNTIATPSGTSDVNGQWVGTYNSTSAASHTVSASANFSTITQTQNVTVNPGAATTAAVSSGNGQSARVTANVATTPTVLITDTFGNPISGVTVTFSGLTGGGSTTGTSVPTNASGLATMGSWTMGGTAADDALGRMANTIGASAPGTNTATFTDFGIYTFSGDVTLIIGTPCTGCHYTAWTRAAIVGVAAHANSAPYVCGGTTLVVAGSASTSLIYEKLIASPPCGVEMPFGGPFLSAATVKMVRAWINNGALNN